MLHGPYHETHKVGFLFVTNVTDMRLIGERIQNGLACEQEILYGERVNIAASPQVGPIGSQQVSRTVLKR